MTRIRVCCWRLWIGCLLVFGVSFSLCAQQTITDLSAIDGVDITPDNILNYQVQLLDPHPADVRIKGVIRYRNSDLRIEYSFNTRLQPGLNSFSRDVVSPRFEFSSGALRELFQIHKVLPLGTYQYCVIITLPNGENTTGGQGDCLFRKSEDQFMISLVDPPNDAKLYEYNPLLTWIATYSFSNELTYRVRVVEMKEGQNAANAIVRNNPVYSERNLSQNTVVYPMYAKPLKAHQPYVWTVDAYYKNILLGGAEPWKFTIIEDSLRTSLPSASSYIDLNIDEGINRYYAVGNIKLKYVENDFLQNVLTLRFVRKGKEVKKMEMVWSVSRGENFTSYDLSDFNLKHNEEFEVIAEFKRTKSNTIKKVIKYKYVNPDFVQ